MTVLFLALAIFMASGALTFAGLGIYCIYRVFTVDPHDGLVGTLLGWLCLTFSLVMGAVAYTIMAGR